MMKNIFSAKTDIRCSHVILLFISALILIPFELKAQPVANQITKTAAYSKKKNNHMPVMGWNSWNKFGCDINENLIMETADAMVRSGMKDAGYEYVNIDDCWMAPKRDADGNLQADSVRFPHGIKYVADYVHKKGLKLGVYSSAGTKTCQGLPASLDHEKADAKKFAEWGVDYLKYDNCYNQNRPAIPRYTKMRDALQATGRPIVYSICEWGSNNPWVWAPKLGDSWRTTGDIRDNWRSMLNILDQQVGLSKFAGPGHWNDPDMLEVGNGGMTTTEYKAHFSLWSLLAAPLLAGNDLRYMSPGTKNILMNKEVIAVNQDPLGKQGYKMEDQGDQEIWVKPLQNNAVAVVLFNRGDAAAFMTTTAKALGMKSDTLEVKDLWEHKTEKRSDGLIRDYVPAHGAKMYKILPRG